MKTVNPYIKHCMDKNRVFPPFKHILVSGQSEYIQIFVLFSLNLFPNLQSVFAIFLINSIDKAQ